MGVIMPVLRADLKFPEDKNTPAPAFYAPDDSLNNYLQHLTSLNSFLKARLSTAKNDSAILMINLPDSTIALQLEGVIIFKTKITEYKLSRIFNKYSPAFLSQWVEYPFDVKNSASSIPKMPVIYKKAPKDTIEAAKQQKQLVIPDEPEDACFSLYTTRNLKIAVNQVERPARLISENRHRYFRKARKLERRELVKSLAKLEIPVHYAYIKIYISRSDARVIYRAIPEHALVVLRL